MLSKRQSELFESIAGATSNNFGCSQFPSSQNIEQEQKEEYIDPLYLEFIEIINRRTHDSVASLNDLEVIANVLQSFRHFSILIRPSQRHESAKKLYKHIQIGTYSRGDFFAHRGEVNQSGLVCILHGKVALYIVKSESLINNEMMTLGKIHTANHQIESLMKSNVGARLSEDKQKSLDQLLKRREFAEDELNKLRNKDETELLRAYNQTKYFKTENICAYAFDRYIEHGSTLGEAQVINGSAQNSTSVCVSQLVGYFSISSSAYREIFNLEISKTSFICNVLARNFPGAKDDSLRRISYDFVQEIYEYNKLIFEENDQANLLMIIRQGEVEATRKTVSQPPSAAALAIAQETIDFQEPLEKDTVQKGSNKQFQLRKQFNKKYQGTTTEMSIGIIGEGEIIGIEDVYSLSRLRSFKAVSKSNETIIYTINRKQLDDIIILNDDSNLKKQLRTSGKYKSDYYQNRTNHIIYHRINSLQEKSSSTASLHAKVENPNFKDLMAEFIKQAKGIPEQQQNKESSSITVSSQQQIQLQISSQTEIFIDSQLITTTPQIQASSSNTVNFQNSPTRTLKKRKSTIIIPLPINTNEIIKEVEDEETQQEKTQQQTGGIVLPQIQLSKNLFSPSKSSSSRKVKSFYTTFQQPTNPISMISEEEITSPFKSELDMLNQLLELKKQRIQVQKTQREEEMKAAELIKQQNSSDALQSGVGQSASQSGNTTSPQLGPLIGGTTNNDFEEMKQRFMQKKQFQLENKKNYRLKSDNSQLNSIIKRAQQLNLEIPESLSPKKTNPKEAFFTNEVLEQIQELGPQSLPVSPVKKSQQIQPYQLSTRMSLHNLHSFGSSSMPFIPASIEPFELKKRNSIPDQQSLVNLGDELLLENEIPNKVSISSKKNNNKFKNININTVRQSANKFSFSTASSPNLFATVSSTRRLSTLEQFNKGYQLAPISTNQYPQLLTKNPASLEMISFLADADGKFTQQPEADQSKNPNSTLMQLDKSCDQQNQQFQQMLVNEEIQASNLGNQQNVFLLKSLKSQQFMRLTRAKAQQANSILVTKSPVITDFVKRSGMSGLDLGKKQIKILQNTGVLNLATFSSAKVSPNKHSSLQVSEGNSSTRKNIHMKPIIVHKIQPNSQRDKEGKSIDSARKARMMANESPLTIGKIIYSKK